MGNDYLFLQYSIGYSSFSLSIVNSCYKLAHIIVVKRYGKKQTLLPLIFLSLFIIIGISVSVALGHTSANALKATLGTRI